MVPSSYAGNGEQHGERSRRRRRCSTRCRRATSSPSRTRRAWSRTSRSTKTQSPIRHGGRERPLYGAGAEPRPERRDARARAGRAPGVITGATWTCAASGAGRRVPPQAVLNVVDALVTLPAGTAATFTIQGLVAPGATGILIEYGRGDRACRRHRSGAGNNTSTVNSGGAPQADLSIVKSASPNPYRARHAADVHDGRAQRRAERCAECAGAGSLPARGEQLHLDVRADARARRRAAWPPARVVDRRSRQPAGWWCGDVHGDRHSRRPT